MLSKYLRVAMRADGAASSRRFFSGSSLARMFIQTESTPNYNAIKFRPGKQILPRSTQSDQQQQEQQQELGYEYTDMKSTINSPLARRLFSDVKSIRSVYFGPDFVTISKAEDADWSVLKPEIFAILMDYLSIDQPVVYEKEEVERLRGQQNFDDGGQPEIVAMIRELLDSRIRPAIQDDGGDVEFMGLSKEGVVKLKLKGSCRGCSSSSITLKNGIESMMKHYIPEVTKVEQVLDEMDELSQNEFNKLESSLEKK